MIFFVHKSNKIIFIQLNDFSENIFCEISFSCIGKLWNVPNFWLDADQWSLSISKQSLLWSFLLACITSKMSCWLREWSASTPILLRLPDFVMQQLHWKTLLKLPKWLWYACTSSKWVTTSSTWMRILHIASVGPVYLATLKLAILWLVLTVKMSGEWRQNNSVNYLQNSIPIVACTLMS